MLFRKIEKLIDEHLRSDSKKILLIDGARQIGKTYIIRHVGEKLFKNYIEINMVEDSLGDRLFENVKTVEDFYLQVSMTAGEKMGKKDIIKIDQMIDLNLDAIGYVDPNITVNIIKNGERVKRTHIDAPEELVDIIN